jgi:hypothetical protein
MSFSKGFISIAVAAALTFPIIAHADTPQCQLSVYNANRVVPLRVEQRVGRGTIQILKGAQVFIPAQAGLSAEWVRVNIERHVAAMRTHSMPNCPLSVADVRVSVVSGGTGFWAQLASDDPAAAREILRRAERIVQ